MGALSVSGTQDLLKDFRTYRKEVERQVIGQLQFATKIMLQALFDKTPVWEGTTVRNYRVGWGSLPGGMEISAVGAGDPGATGSMGAPPAGEPRRAENEAAAMADAQRTLAGISRLGIPIFITNTAQHFDLVDNGSAPTPDRARNPGGVSVLAEQTARAKLGDMIL